jgi:serine/threonine protein phosphatase PrpC
MSDGESALRTAGWTLATGSASLVGDADHNHDFHAIYADHAFGSLRRGVVATVARAGGAGRRATEAVQIAVHEFVEAYFSVAATLGDGRAADVALSSVNGWLYDQSRRAPLGDDLTVSLSAVVFRNRHVGLIHVGGGRIYRRRQGQVIALTTAHVRRLADQRTILTRTVGGDRDLHIDYVELPAEPGDRYILVSEGTYSAVDAAWLADRLAAELPPPQLAEATVRDVAAQAGKTGGATVVVIDVQTVPEAGFDDLASVFTTLPIRPLPQDGDNWDGFIVGPTLHRSHYTMLKRAYDSIGHRDVVLKIPLPPLLRDEVLRAGFLREAWVGGMVHSSSVAQYIEVSPERRSSLYLVMPFYPGETLEKRIGRKPPLTVAEGVGIAFALCKAIQNLAAIQVIHRDLKPDNIILSSDGEVRLLDLGFAYLPGIDGPDDGSIGGTTRYMAPELFQGVPANARTEVFALGVTLFRLFNRGEFPFGHGAAHPALQGGRDLPPWLTQCLMRAIDEDPDQRFVNAGELARALQDGLARGAPSGDGGWARRRRHTLWIWQSLTVALAVALAVVLLSGWRL